MPIDEDVTIPLGTVVGPNVMAAYHQHILSLRIGPAVDCHKNDVVYEDTEQRRTSCITPGTLSNLHSPTEHRRFTTTTRSTLSVNGKQGKIMMLAKQMLLADFNFFISIRTQFATQ
ncbi:hypothetical protein METBIDRAFT_9379 [Metschnikowia bicuspidata var. bicuspidata NRRL YB-4993]|uniref:Copper amine oxidase catalytic domain-containing protein n=1 Tax=Metschnikowia bicuspidata var. bicuspidata NRRL YB-4993 TaxID=869754 RepID=A0A1A0HGQ5_9ASCO|nr:hypothetical protein METBIDRAFT_9379 [Metschnikowia bicuspidata var. bicuspidata NRRL YB-4993]OBA23062.1 hypothetical protein METBIDRAFT_9379 [Metschnikowia bicuspidata var. bicuspidata NRRL YB-4993]